MEIIRKEKVHVVHPRGVSEYMDFDLLGFGSFGCVFQCKNKFDGKKYAIKNIVHKSKDKYVIQILNEIRITSALNHPNIIRYFTSWVELVDNEDPEISFLKENDDSMNTLSICSKKKISAYLVMECADLTLDKFITMHYKSEVFDKNHKSIISQIANGIQYLHNLNPKCAHGDLTTKNILLVNNGNMQVKICDFGMSTFIVPDTHKTIENLPLNTHVSTINTKKTADELCTDAVELQYNSQYKNHLYFDIFRFGIIIFQLITYFTTSMHRSKLIEKFKQRQIFTGISIIDDMISEDKFKQPTINMFCTLCDSYQEFLLKHQYN